MHDVDFLAVQCSSSLSRDKKAQLNYCAVLMVVNLALFLWVAGSYRYKAVVHVRERRAPPRRSLPQSPRSESGRVSIRLRQAQYLLRDQVAELHVALCQRF